MRLRRLVVHAIEVLVVKAAMLGFLAWSNACLDLRLLGLCAVLSPSEPETARPACGVGVLARRHTLPAGFSDIARGVEGLLGALGEVPVEDEFEGGPCVIYVFTGTCILEGSAGTEVGLSPSLGRLGS